MTNTITTTAKRDEMKIRAAMPIEESINHVAFKTEEFGNSFAVTQQGISHYDKCEEGEDRFLFKEENGRKFYGVADGCGSAKFGGLGAELVLEAITKYVMTEKMDSFPETKEELCKKLQDVIVYTISNYVVTNVPEEEQSNYKLKDFRATFMFVVITPKVAFSCHLGDGCILGQDKTEGWKVLSSEEKVGPRNGTYYFDVGQKTFCEQLVVNFLDLKNYNQLVLSTDGLEPMLYQFKSGEVFHRVEIFNELLPSEGEKLIQDLILLAKTQSRILHDDNTFMVIRP